MGQKERHSLKRQLVTKYYSAELDVQIEYINPGVTSIRNFSSDKTQVVVVILSEHEQVIPVIEYTLYPT